MDKNKLTRRSFISIGAAGALALTSNLGASDVSAKSKEMLLYIGTYTQNTKSEGVYVYKFNEETGALSKLFTVKNVAEPSYLTIDKDRKYLFAVNELLEYEGAKAGAVSAFAIDQKTGDLKFINKVSSLGGAPCFITTSENKKFALVANYLGGNAASFPINADGSLSAAVDLKQNAGTGPNRDRQEAAHAHSITLDEKNRFAALCDLGVDKIFIYEFDDQTGRLKTNPNQPFFAAKAGAGPRHFAFHKNGKNAFVANELDLSVTSLAYDDRKGTLREIQTVPTLPSGASSKGATCADLHISPNGKFVYASTRAHDSLTVFKFDEKTGRLETIQNIPTGGKTPRNFTIAPNGKFLLAANQTSGSIIVFAVDEQTGKLTPTANKADVPAPVCLKLIPGFA